jgi:hypothetical protein
VKEAVAQVGTTHDAYKAARLETSAIQAKVALALENELAAKGASNQSILLLKGLTEENATTADELISTGYAARGPRAAVELAPPPSLDVYMGKKGYGKLRISAHYPTKARRVCAAQWSADPYDDASWQNLPGTGKSRKLSGKSGTSIWVRMALIRGQQQSEWSTPVRVTFP